MTKLASLGGSRVVFVGGIHGVGKSTICAQVCAELGQSHLIASDLIRAERLSPPSSDKRVDSVGKNQDVLVNALTKVLVPSVKMVLLRMVIKSLGELTSCQVRSWILESKSQGNVLAHHNPSER